MSETKIVAVHLTFIDSSTVVDIASMTHRESALRPLRVRAKLDRHAIGTVSMAVDVPSPVAEVISCHGS